MSPQPSSLALGGQQLQSQLASHPEVGAIFICNDDPAQGGLLANLRLGIPVPQRLAIAGFNDLAGSDQMWQPLTTIRTSRVEIGESAVVMLLALMRGAGAVLCQCGVGVGAAAECLRWRVRAPLGYSQAHDSSRARTRRRPNFARIGGRV